MSEDIFGRPIETTDKLTAYWNWILKETRNNPNVRFVNATEGGILQGGMEIVSLKEALHRYCTEILPLRRKIDQIFRDSKTDNLHYSDTELSLLAAEASAIRDILAAGFRLCRPGVKYPAVELLKRLEDIKERIYFNSRMAPLIDSLNQMGNITFLRRRTALDGKSPGRDSIPEIRSIYGDYFETVRRALETSAAALKRIRGNLHPHTSSASKAMH